MREEAEFFLTILAIHNLFFVLIKICFMFGPPNIFHLLTPLLHV